MTKFLAIVKREYLTRVRTKMFIVVTVLGPVMILVFADARHQRRRRNTPRHR